MIALRAYTLIGIVAAALALLAVSLGGDFFLETLGLPPRALGAFALLLVTLVVIAVLWRAALREGARKPGGPANRGKQRSDPADGKPPSGARNP